MTHERQSSDGRQELQCRAEQRGSNFEDGHNRLTIPIYYDSWPALARSVLWNIGRVQKRSPCMAISATVLTKGLAKTMKLNNASSISIPFTYQFKQIVFETFIVNKLWLLEIYSEVFSVQFSYEKNSWSWMCDNRNVVETGDGDRIVPCLVAFGLLLHYFMPHQNIFLQSSTIL